MLSQTTEYALRAMSCLAYYPDQLTPTPQLASMTKVPPNYLAKVLQLLAQHDLIIGRRGVGGGYRLAKQASEITLLDVVAAIDPVDRITTCPLGLTNHGGELCPLHKAVDCAAEKLISTFDGVTLQSLVNDPDANRPLCDEDLTSHFKLTVGETGSANGSNGASNGSGNGNA